MSKNRDVLDTQLREIALAHPGDTAGALEAAYQLGRREGIMFEIGRTCRKLRARIKRL